MITLCHIHNPGPGTITMFALLTPGAVQTSLQQQDTWICTINGVPMVQLKLDQYNIAVTQEICSGNANQDTMNEFIFTLTEPSPGVMDVLFDYLEYNPIPSTTPQNYSFIAISSDDSSVQYQGGWHPDRDYSGTITGMLADSGSSMEYTFNGM